MFARIHVGTRTAVSRPLRRCLLTHIQTATIATTKRKRATRASKAKDATATLESAEQTDATEVTDATPAKESYYWRRKRQVEAENPKLPQKYDIARRLEDTGLWSQRRRGKQDKAIARLGDKHRVNIVSDGLCDDIIKYIGPSLERHRGCDLVDINPGVGLWSRKLHEALQPRKHVLMEKDMELYQPYLSDLIAKDNVEVVAKSGLLWRDLNEMIREHLPNQVPMDKNLQPERNDTLLISVNLAMYPRKKYMQFECVSDLVMYQFMSSIRTGALFQKYGVVRMLFWISDDSKRKVLPRSVIGRRRGAFEAELSCEWIREVVGKDIQVENERQLRDEWINMESGYQALARMEKQGLTMPPGRETFTYQSLMADQSLKGQKLAGVRAPELARPYKQELEELEEDFAHADAEDAAAEASKRLKNLRYREKYGTADSMKYLELLQERDAVTEATATSPDQFAAANAAFNHKIDLLKKNSLKEYSTLRDNYHLFRQNPPALFWDQRPFEPLNVSPNEFFPNHACTLLDIQPRAMPPLLRDHGASSGNMSDMMLRSWFNHRMSPVSHAMDSLWPGLSDLIAECPSLTDPARGGSPLTGSGELNARSINAQQWTEIMTATTNSPFRPTYSQIVKRLVDDQEMAAEEDDFKSGAMGGGQF
ncbi:Fc.00g026060.m01.CDS01 [Cosmosporella sp. VM-42]